MQTTAPTNGVSTSQRSPARNTRGRGFRTDTSVKELLVVPSIHLLSGWNIQLLAEFITEVADKSHSSPSTESLKGCQESQSPKSQNHSKYIRRITCTNQLGQRACQNPDYARDRAAGASTSLLDGVHGSTNLPLLPTAAQGGNLLPAATQNSSQSRNVLS